MANVRHTFAICAYGKSEYLTECIESVLNQEGVRSEVYIATSTPSDWLSDIANRYGLPVYVNDGEHGIGQDWNFAYSKATGDYVTIAHQDDVYCPGYAAEALRAFQRANGLGANGEVNQKTLDALYEAGRPTPAPTVTPESTPVPESTPSPAGK